MKCILKVHVNMIQKAWDKKAGVRFGSFKQRRATKVRQLCHPVLTQKHIVLRVDRGITKVLCVRQTIRRTAQLRQDIAWALGLLAKRKDGHRLDVPMQNVLFVQV